MLVLILLSNFTHVQCELVSFLLIELLWLTRIIDNTSMHDAGAVVIELCSSRSSYLELLGSPHFSTTYDLTNTEIGSLD